MEKLLLFHPEMISAHLLWGNMFLREDLSTGVKKKSNFEIFESALYLKSRSMPLSFLKVVFLLHGVAALCNLVADFCNRRTPIACQNLRVCNNLMVVFSTGERLLQSGMDQSIL